ncbi:MAG: hypothetical protein DMG88_05830 [Acidobacteria bacterium]|nr:MAG: hypothetical protein DMG88_05830 [Acidobacteriota bacterium]
MNGSRKLKLGLQHLGSTWDFLWHRIPAGRQVTVRAGDLFIVSYPRSGNTWTRFLIGNLIYPDEPITFANVESRIPSLYLFSDRQLRHLPRIFKSHECFDPRYKNVIYITRDPRDVAVSAYHYSIKVNILPEDFPVEDFVPLFMSGEFGSGLLSDPRWGSWYDNVQGWLAMRHNRRFLLLRYEDMLQQPARELLKIAEFLNISGTPERLNRAIDLSSADRMRRLEKAEAKEWKLTKNTRQDKRFVREARSGTWKSELPPKSVQQIESEWGDLMQSLGYELSGSKGTPAEKPALAGS